MYLCVRGIDFVMCLCVKGIDFVSVSSIFFIGFMNCSHSVFFAFLFDSLDLISCTVNTSKFQVRETPFLYITVSNKTSIVNLFVDRKRLTRGLYQLLIYVSSFE